MPFPAALEDGTIVKIARKEGDVGQERFFDVDGNEYERSAYALKLRPVAKDAVVADDVDSDDTSDGEITVDPPGALVGVVEYEEDVVAVDPYPVEPQEVPLADLTAPTVFKDPELYGVGSSAADVYDLPVGSSAPQEADPTDADEEEAEDLPPAS